MFVRIRAMRLPFLTGSVTPVMLGGAYAWYRNCFEIGPFVLVVLGVAFLHIGANLINDYFDAEGTDRINQRLTPFSGGSRVIQENLLPRKTILHMSTLFFCAALLVGVTLAVWRVPGILVVGALGFLAGCLYSYKPVRLMSRGIGEPTIFLAFGPFITFGTFYALARTPDISSFWLGIPSGLLITAVIWINEFPDFEADRDTGKHNLVVRLGLDKSRYVYTALVMLPYPTLIALAALPGYSPWLLLTFCIFPLSLRGVRLLSRTYEDRRDIVSVQALTIRLNLFTGLLMSACLILGKAIERVL